MMWKCKLEHEWIAAVKSRTINKIDYLYRFHNKVLAGMMSGWNSCRIGSEADMQEW